jgi:hypothetical protein
MVHVVDREQRDSEPYQGNGEKHEQAEPVQHQPDVEGFTKPEKLLDGRILCDEAASLEKDQGQEDNEDRIHQKIG